MNRRLASLIASHDAALAAAREITDGLGDDESLTDEQRDQVKAHLEQARQTSEDIELEKALEQEALTLPAEPDGGHGLQITGGEPRLLQDPQLGFRDFGEFCQAVYNAGTPGGPGPDDRLIIIQAAAPTTFGSEGVGQDGGFLVPPVWSDEIFTHSLEQDAILPLTDNFDIARNSMIFPKDETTPWGTDGIRAFWEAEAAVANATKPKLGKAQLYMHKLFALVPITDELLEDANALGQFVQGKSAESIRWKSNDAFVNGTGPGFPLGIRNAPALVSVPKEAAQPADTLEVANVAKMFARMPAGSLFRAIWMINNDVLPQLITMVLNNQPIFTAPGALPSAPAGALLGRPIMITQHAQTLGDQGDIYFVDWKMYRTITKAGGIQTATSIHLYFDAGATAFRAIFRVDGQPTIASPIVPARGGNNLSPFVTLDERA